MATNKRPLDPKNEKLVSITEVLDVISDDKSIILFNTIASKGGDSSILISNLSLSRKQYYTRVGALLRCGVIKKLNRGYAVTSFGKIVYDAQNKIENAIKCLWKLVVIDSLDASTSKIPNEERRKIIDKILENEEVKEILLAGDVSISQDIQYNRNSSVASIYTRYAT